MENQPIAVLCAALFLQLAWLLFSLLIDPYISKRHKRIMLLNGLLAASLVFADMLGVEFEVKQMVFARKAASVYQYSMRPVVIVLFMQIIKKDAKPWVLAGINAAVFLTAFFSGIAFTITPDNHFLRGPLGYSSHIVSGILMIWYVCICARRYRSDRRSENLFLIAIAGCVVTAVVLDSVFVRHYVIGFLTAASVSACVFNYIWLHLQFVREHEADLKAQQRIRTTISQIQPHFIYNSLTAIRSYLDEPEKAEDVLDHFALFLRGSIDVLDCTECVPAARELETVDSYLYMEKERFGNKLTVVTDWKDTDFLLPPFTVQILAENAVRHGIRGNKGGCGTLTIRTYRAKGAHVIEVQDDGKGFDAAILAKLQSGAEMQGHIGLKNLRERLALMCGGTLTIESEPGKGALVRVRLPHPAGNGEARTNENTDCGRRGDSMQGSYEGTAYRGTGGGG